MIRDYTIIPNPPRDKINVWGVLAFVSDEDRKEILSLQANEIRQVKINIEAKLSRMGIRW